MVLIASGEFSVGVDSRVTVIPLGNPDRSTNLTSKEWTVQIMGMEHDITYAHQGATEPDAGFVSTIIDNFQADVHVVGYFSEEENPFGIRVSLFPGKSIHLKIYPEKTNTAQYFDFPVAIVINVTPSSMIRGVTILDFNVRSQGAFFVPIYA